MEIAHPDETQCLMLPDEDCVECIEKQLILLYLLRSFVPSGKEGWYVIPHYLTVVTLQERRMYAGVKLFVEQTEQREAEQAGFE